MKRRDEPTRKQKECLAANKTSPKVWLFVKETDFYFVFEHKGTGRRLILCKYKGGVNYA